MLKYWLALFAAVILSAFSQMLLKHGAKNGHTDFLRQYLDPWVIGGYFLLALSAVLVVFAHRGVEYKNVPVIESLGFPLVMLLGRVFFGEKLNKNKIIGVCMILAGVLVYYL